MTPQLLLLLVQFGLTYGPQAVTQITTLLQNPNATVADVEAAFSNLKPYSAYNINAPVSVPVVPPVNISGPAIPSSIAPARVV